MTSTIDIEKMLVDKEIKFRESIPSKVFFNHFHAIYIHLSNDSNKLDLKKIPYFNKLKLNNKKFDVKKCESLLLNSWSTEYAFSIQSSVDNNQYYEFALHWLFPQAYYTIYLALTAFHETQGLANEQHEKSIKIFGNSIKDGHYPKAISFYARGTYKNTSIENLRYQKSDFNGLTNIRTMQDATNQICSFLKSTREQNAKNKRERGEKNFSKDPRFQNQKGQLIKRFTQKHWDLIYKTIPETTLLNLIYRLRIKANYHDIQTFINADIDFEKFHKYLGEIIDYMNFVHEAYILKVLGEDKFKVILQKFHPNYLETRPGKRFKRIQSSLL